MRANRVIKMLALVLALALTGYAQTIPAGTRVTVRLNSRITSETARPGQTFDGVLARDVVVNSNTVGKAGTPVKGKVSKAQASGRLSKPGLVSLRLTSVGDTPVTTASVSRHGKSHTKSNVTKIGGGAAAGAVIGGIAGGGKGAAIGTLAGGGAGTGVAAATGKQEAVFPAESVVTFTVSGAQNATAKKSTTRK